MVVEELKAFMNNKLNHYNANMQLYQNTFLDHIILSYYTDFQRNKNIFNENVFPEFKTIKYNLFSIIQFLLNNCATYHFTNVNSLPALII